MPQLNMFCRKIRANDSAITVLMSLTSNTQGACSREEPQPKLERDAMTRAALVFSPFGSKPGSLRSSSRYGFRSSLVISVRYLDGMISSVLMSERSRNRAGPPKVFISFSPYESRNLIDYYP